MNSLYLDTIKRFEGFSPAAKPDYAQVSNGYGTRARFAGEVIDMAEAERRFTAEIGEARAIVDRNAPAADEGTKAALTSLTFNAGDAWTRSGLGEAVRGGDLTTAKALFQQYTKAGGDVLPGLVARRAAEAEWIGQPVATQMAKTEPMYAAAGTIASTARPEQLTAGPARSAIHVASLTGADDGSAAQLIALLAGKPRPPVRNDDERERTAQPRQLDGGNRTGEV